jgi:integrase
MKLSVVLEKRHEKVNGKYPVKIRFNFLSRAFYVSTGIEVQKEHFVLGKIIGLPKATLMNNIVAQKLDYTQNVLEDLQLRGLLKTKFKTGSEIKHFIESGAEGYDDLDINERMKLHFKTYTEKHLKKYTSKSSATQYKLMLKKVESFCSLEHMFISDITVSWLKDFDTFCDKSGMSVNGKGNYMRAIRTIFNDAIDRELIGFDKYPFRRFKIKRIKTKHRNVTVKDLRYMLNFDYDVLYAELKAKAKKHTSEFPNIKKYVDLFFLSFYLCGMNVKDLLLLKKSDIRNGQLSIMRIKTDEPIVIRIEPEAQQIIDHYPGEKYLLNFLDAYSTDDYRNVERRMNLNIKYVLPFVTGYWGRHSWATIAGELDIPDPIIDIAQGRTVTGMSGVYINRNIKKVSQANRKVIDYLFKRRKRKMRSFKMIRKIK